MMNTGLPFYAYGKSRGDSIAMARLIRLQCFHERLIEHAAGGRLKNHIQVFFTPRPAVAIVMDRVRMLCYLLHIVDRSLLRVMEEFERLRLSRVLGTTQYEHRVYWKRLWY